MATVTLLMPVSSPSVWSRISVAKRCRSAQRRYIRSTSRPIGGFGAAGPGADGPASRCAGRTGRRTAALDGPARSRRRVAGPPIRRLPGRPGRFFFLGQLEKLECGVGARFPGHARAGVPLAGPRPSRSTLLGHRWSSQKPIANGSVPAPLDGLPSKRGQDARVAWIRRTRSRVPRPVPQLRPRASWEAIGRAR